MSTTSAHERAAQVMELTRAMKAKMGQDLSPQIDVENTKGERAVFLLAGGPAQLPEALRAVRETLGPLAVAVFIADAFMRWQPVEDPLPPAGRLQEEYLRDPDVLEVLTVTALDAEGNVALLVTRYGRNDDGTYHFGDVEEQDVAASSVIEVLREVMA